MDDLLIALFFIVGLIAGVVLCWRIVNSACLDAIETAFAKRDELEGRVSDSETGKEK
jgi:hypothetical protein